MSHKVEMPDGMPRAMRNLKRDDVGRPIPFFVEMIDDKPDFRVMSAKHLRRAVMEGLCWLCGEQLHRERGRLVGTFVSGPMCLINKNSAEPPAHEECALWAARACPFLTNPNKERREANLPGGAQPMPGEAIMRNPGVTALIRCSRWTPYSHQGGLLFRMITITYVEWMCEGREATSGEVFASIETGLPALVAIADEEGSEAQTQLALMTTKALLWIGEPDPAEFPLIAKVADSGWAA